MSACPDCHQIVDHANGIAYQQHIYWYTCNNCGLMWREESKIYRIGNYKRGDKRDAMS